jgi:hypothetical protein
MIRWFDGVTGEDVGDDWRIADASSTKPLEALVEALLDRGLAARLVWFGVQQRVSVLNRSIRHLSESIYAAPAPDGTVWFWWSWHDQIAPVSEVLETAARVVKVLMPSA